MLALGALAELLDSATSEAFSDLKIPRLYFLRSSDSFTLSRLQRVTRRLLPSLGLRLPPVPSLTLPGLGLLRCPRALGTDPGLRLPEGAGEATGAQQGWGRSLRPRGCALSLSGVTRLPATTPRGFADS